jgi:glucokinase
VLTRSIIPDASPIDQSVDARTSPYLQFGKSGILRPFERLILEHDLFMSDRYLTVDLGGTRIRAARCRSDGTIEMRTEQLTQASQGVDAVVDRIEQALRRVWPASPDMGTSDIVRAVGVVAPGPVDPWTGVVFTAPNLPGFEVIPLRDRLAEILHRPVYLGNDANLAGLAEWRFGAARGHQHVIYLTISTGIGGGVIIDGRLLLGSRGLAAELGHVTADVNSDTCLCGNVGCIEWLASGTGIVRQAIKRIESGETSQIAGLANGDLLSVNVELIRQAAEHGDRLANSVLDQAFRSLGLTVTSMLHTFNPSIVVIGGGVSNLGDRLFGSIRAVVEQHVMDSRYLCPIVPAQLGGDVGLLGALALALDPPPQRPA